MSASEIDGRVHWADRHNFNQTQWQRCCRGHVKPAQRYMNELLRLQCGPDLLALGLFPDAKELAESFAAYTAVKKHAPSFDMADQSVQLLSVGDGHTPRTAATFAFRTSWSCHSIDPCMRPANMWPVKRLATYTARAEDTKISASQAVIVGVHTHACWDAMLHIVPTSARTCLVVMPCCEPRALPPGGFDLSYDDEGVPSPDRTIYVYGPERVAKLRASLVDE